MTSTLADATASIRQAIHQHLTEEELALYLDDAMEPIHRQLAQAHLDRCLVCSRRQGYTAELLATAWETESEPEEDAGALERILVCWQAERDLAQEAAADRVRFLVSVTLLARGALRAAAWQAETAQTGATEDGSLEWRIEDDDGDLTIWLGSPRMELANATVALRANGVRKEVVLTPKAGGQVGAKVTITAAERQSLKEDAELVIENIEVPVHS